MSIQTEYNSWHTATVNFFDNPLDFQWYQTTLKLLPDLNNLKVLEIGCGRGAFSRLIVQRFPLVKLTAVDISEVAIQEAKKTPGAIDFQVGNAEQLGLPDNSFDFIFSCETLEHIPVPGRMTGEIYRLLKPGGGYIITTENYFNALALLWLKSWMTKKRFDTGSSVQPYENFFLFFGVSAIIRKSGLKIDHTESNHFQWLVLPRVNPSKLTTMDFKQPFLKKLFKPFGRHYTFKGHKPA